MCKFDYPRVEMGHWVSVEPCEQELMWHNGSRILQPTYFADRTLTCVSGSLVLSCIDKIVGTFPIPPTIQTDQVLVFSICGNWIWYFGSENERALVRLFNGHTLELVDSYSPRERSDWAEEPGAHLSEWYELSVVVDGAIPNTVLAVSNAGDSPAVCSAFKVDNAQIVELNHSHLITNIFRELDEHIGTARLISEKRILVIDDISQLFLFDLQTGQKIASNHVGYAFEVGEDEFEIWPETGRGCEPIEIGFEVGVLDELLLVNIGRYSFGDFGSSEPQSSSLNFVCMGMAAIDVKTLEPIGLVRPPDVNSSELTQTSGLIFTNSPGTFWRLERT